MSGNRLLAPGKYRRDDQGDFQFNGDTSEFFVRVRRVTGGMASRYRDGCVIADRT